MHNKGGILDDLLINESTEIGNHYYSKFTINRGKYAVKTTNELKWSDYTVDTEGYVVGSVKKAYSSCLSILIKD